jgi:hypothetical protein
MPRQERRVVTDAFVFGVIDDPSRWNGNNQWRTLLFDLSGWENRAVFCQVNNIWHTYGKTGEFCIDLTKKIKVPFLGLLFCLK